LRRKEAERCEKVDTVSTNGVIWPSPPAWKKRDLVRKLRRTLHGRVDAAYLFGSHARGDATLDSDIDLLLVRSTQAPWPDRFGPFSDLWDTFGAVDLLVYTPAEWKTMLAQKTPFIAKAKSEWVRLV
jgi:predicted nucleotidyltransferase